MTSTPDDQAFAADGTGERAEVGVLLCHGFTGSPVSMRPWADHLASAGYTVRLPLLPGHGTSWQEMNTTTFQDYLRALETELAQLRARCRAVVVCGLSMGGTLALRLAQVHADQVAALILVNPSVMSTRLDARLAPVLMRLRPLLRRVLPSRPAIADDIKRGDVTERGYERIPTLAALSLAAAWPVVRRALGAVRCPVLLLHSTVDHVVEPANAAIVLAGISSPVKREVLLTNSFHVATLDNDAELIFAESVTFIDEVA